MGKPKEFKITEKNTQVINEYISLRKDKGKSKNTLLSNQYVLEKFGHFLKDKQFKDANDKDLRNYMNTIAFGSYNTNAILLIDFYRWLLNLEKDQRPDNLKWLEYKSKKDKQRIQDPEEKKKYLITPEEYQTILNYLKKDRYGMWEALFETYWLSGGRLNEVRNMLIKDIIKVNDGTKVKVGLRGSKTINRTVALAEYPENLIRWKENHPDKDNPGAFLWVSVGNRNYGKQISRNTIQQKIMDIRNNTNVKDTISIHCFRKTRATEMFNKKSKDGGLIYSDTHMALFFGWSIKTVAERREEYDLEGQKELEDLIFNQKPTQEKQDYDTLKSQKERLENQYQKKIADMEQDMWDMKRLIDQLMTATTGQPSTF